MKKTILLIMVLLLALAVPLTQGLTTSYTIDKKPTGAWWSGGRKDFAWRWAMEIETILEEDAILFTPTSTVPTATKGRMYYDIDTNGFKFFDGVSWVNFDAAGTGSLDAAYDIGSSVTVDSTTLTLRAPNANDKVPLTLTQEDTSTTKALVITNAGTGNSIDIQGQSSAKDIEGTGDLWSVSTVGVGTYAGLILGGTDIVMENADTFANSTDDYFVFTSNDKEDFIIDLSGSTSNEVKLSSTSAATIFDFGTFVTVEGISTITGSAAGDLTIQHTADTADEDLIISQLGSGAYSVLIQSAGTGTDSISLQATKGIDIDSVDDMAITNTASTNGDDFLIQQVGAFDSSLLLTSEGTGLDAIGLATSSTSGSIKVNSGDLLDIDAVDHITIDLSGSGSNLDIDSAAGSIYLDAGEAVANAIVLTATTALGGIDITSNADIDITTTGTTGEDITISNTGGSILITATEDVTDNIDIDAEGGIDIDIQAGGSRAFDVNAPQITLNAVAIATDSFNIDTQGGIDIDMGGGATYDFDVNTLASINFTTKEAATNAIRISTQGGIDIDMGAGSTYDFDVNTLASVVFKSGQVATDSFDFDTQGGFDIDMGGGSTYDFDVNTLASINFTAKQAAVSDAVVINASGDDGCIDIDAGDNVTIDANQINITAADAEGTSAIDIETNGDVTDTLRIYANQSTTAVSIQLLSDAGGITATASAGPILLNALGTNAGDLTITVEDDFILPVEGLWNVDVNGTVDVNSLTTVTLNSWSTGTAAISLQAKGDEGDIDIDASDTITVDANVITITASGTEGASNLTAETNASASDVLKIYANQGTGATSIYLLSDVGGITQTALAGAFIFNATGGTAGDWTATIGSEYILDVTGGLVMTSSEAADDAIELVADGSAGGIKLNSLGDILLTTAGASGEDIMLTNTGGSISLSATEVSVTDAIVISASGMNGGIDIDAAHLLAVDANVFSIDSVELGNITVTAAADDNDLTIAQAGIYDASLILSSVGTAADSIKITTDGGGIDIDMGTASAGEDFDVNSCTSINLTGKEAASDAIKFSAPGANAGIDVDAGHLIAMDANTFSIDGVELGNITVTSAADGNDLTIALAGTGNSSLLLSSIGTAADAMSFQVTGDEGSIDMDAGATIAIDANVITITASDTDAAGVSNLTVETNGHTSDVLKIYANQGNADDSIYLLSDVGGITINSAAGSVDIEAMTGGGEAGDIILNAGDDMTLTVAGDFVLDVTGSTTLPNDVLLKTTTAISDVQMDNLAATPITVVASPSGTDKTIEFISAVFALDWGGTAWTEPSAPDDLVIRYTNGSGAIVSQLLDATGFATATEDTIAFLTPTVSDAAGASLSSVAVTEAASTDQALVLHNTGSEWTNSGSSQVVVIVYYRVHTTSELGL